MAVSIIHDTQGLRCYLLLESQSKFYIALQKRDYTAYFSFTHLKTQRVLNYARKNQFELIIWSVFVVADRNERKYRQGLDTDQNYWLVDG
jgi:hypothetical protein